MSVVMPPGEHDARKRFAGLQNMSIFSPSRSIFRFVPGLPSGLGLSVIGLRLRRDRGLAKLFLVGLGLGLGVSAPVL